MNNKRLRNVTSALYPCAFGLTMGQSAFLSVHSLLSPCETSYFFLNQVLSQDARQHFAKCEKMWVEHFQFSELKIHKCLRG